MTEWLQLAELAAQLRHVYNPRITSWVTSWGNPAAGSENRRRWLAVARAAGWAATTDDREQLAQKLHAAFVADIPGQREHGWPPLSDGERDRWLAVADALLQREVVADG